MYHVLYNVKLFENEMDLAFDDIWLVLDGQFLHFLGAPMIL
jgi:hypothetical protein